MSKKAPLKIFLKILSHILIPHYHILEPSSWLTCRKAFQMNSSVHSKMTNNNHPNTAKLQWTSEAYLRLLSHYFIPLGPGLDTLTRAHTHTKPAVARQQPERWVRMCPRACVCACWSLRISMSASRSMLTRRSAFHTCTQNHTGTRYKHARAC